MLAKVVAATTLHRHGYGDVDAGQFTPPKLEGRTPETNRKGPGPMIEPLCDAGFFARAFLEFGAPTWLNGFDLDPIHLYLQLRAPVCWRGGRGVRTSVAAARRAPSTSPH